jgi:hypothetical protein
METAKQLFVRALRELASDIEADRVEVEDHIIMREKVETIVGQRETVLRLIVVRYRSKSDAPP